MTKLQPTTVLVRCSTLHVVYYGIEMYGALRLNGGRWPAGRPSWTTRDGDVSVGWPWGRATRRLSQRRGLQCPSIRAPLSAYGRKWKKTTQPNGDRMEAPKSDTRVTTTDTTVQLYILASRGTRYM